MRGFFRALKTTLAWLIAALVGLGAILKGVKEIIEGWKFLKEEGSKFLKEQDFHEIVRWLSDIWHAIPIGHVILWLIVLGLVTLLGRVDSFDPDECGRNT